MNRMTILLAAVASYSCAGPRTTAEVSDAATELPSNDTISAVDATLEDAEVAVSEVSAEDSAWESTNHDISDVSSDAVADSAPMPILPIQLQAACGLACDTLESLCGFPTEHYDQGLCQQQCFEDFEDAGFTKLLETIPSCILNATLADGTHLACIPAEDFDYLAVSGCIDGSSGSCATVCAGLEACGLATYQGYTFSATGCEVFCKQRFSLVDERAACVEAAAPDCEKIDSCRYTPVPSWD